MTLVLTRWWDLGYNEKAVSVLLSASFTINYGDRRLFGVNLAEKSHQCPLINLLNHAFELYSSTESELTIRTFWYLGLCEMFVQKMSMKSEGQRKKMLDIGHFSPAFEWGKLSSTMGPQWQNQALELFFLPESSRDWCYATVFFDPMRSHSQRLDWLDIII